MRSGRLSSIFKRKAEKSERGNMAERNLRAPTVKNQSYLARVFTRDVYLGFVFTLLK